MRVKVLLMQPFTHGRTTIRPLGIAYLASFLFEKTTLDIEVRILDMDEKKFSDSELKSYAGEFKPDVIGITTNILNQFNALRNAELLKDYPYVIFGGPEATLDPGHFIKHDNFYVVKGEGEVIFSNIISAVAEGRDIRQVKGITYRDSDGSLINTSQEELIKDLDALPIPNINLFNFNSYISRNMLGMYETAMISSRGCPFKCIYCYHQLNANFRQRSPANLIEEMIYYRDNYGFKAIKFFDDNFTIRRRFIVEFCEQLIKKRVGMKWSCLSAARNVDQEILNLIKKAGCWLIRFGIESGTQKTLVKIGKKTTVEQNRAAIEMCRRAGIMSKAYIMVGFPWETKEDILETGRFLRDTPPDMAQILIATPMPNTMLEAMVIEAGYSIDIDLIEGARDFNIPTFETKNFTKAELRDLHGEVIHMYKTSPKLRFYNFKNKFRRRLNSVINIE